jgi:integral membrane protein (TIGR01906 family)
LNLVKRSASLFITIITPFFLIMTAINLLITPYFAWVEYHLPGFPDDPYGLTQVERIEMSKFAINYLRNQEGIEYLGNLTFRDGTPQYNERELDHMVDVKVLVNQMIGFWYFSLAAILMILIFSIYQGWKNEFLAGLLKGAYLTIGLIFTILLAVFTNFNVLFTGFHKIFFEGSTWIFKYSDTLIRLFPLRFWQDAFIFVGGFALLGAAMIILLKSKFSSFQG